METIEAIKKRQAAELEDWKKKLSVVAELPITIDSIMAAYYGQFWVTHKAKTAADVAAIIRAYSGMIISTTEFRDGCLYRTPIELMPKRIQAAASEKGVDVVFSLDVEQGRGFGPSVSFWFYAKTESGVFVRVRCELPNNHKLSAVMRRPDYDRRGNCLGNGSSSANAMLNGLFDKFIKWTPNVNGEDARFTYTLSDDAPFSNTLSILENSEFSELWKV